MYLIYITSVTVINKEEDFSSSNDNYANDSYKDVLTTNVSVPEQMSSLNNPLETTNDIVKYLTTVVTEDVVSEEPERYFPCKDRFKAQGLWRNLSRQHWPELLDHYGVNVMDRYMHVVLFTLCAVYSGLNVSLRERVTKIISDTVTASIVLIQMTIKLISLHKVL